MAYDNINNVEVVRWKFGVFLNLAHKNSVSNDPVFIPY